MQLRILLLVSLLLSCTLAHSQELRCRVTVNAEQIQVTNKKIFKTLETSISEFMNNYKWTKDNFTIDERIECALLITVSKFDAPDQFTATIQVNASRPVFNSNYSSTLINFRDQDFNFNYIENSPIEFTPDQFRSNLSSVLAYYAYLIIGLDYDSFSKEGGTEYFAEAQRVVNNAQNTASRGWTASENLKNRFWIIDNTLQQAFQPLRICYYEYHRNGLDVMYENPVEGRRKIMESLEGLKKVHQVKPLSFNVQLFFNAKGDEIISLFSKAPPAEKTRVLAILKQIDPVNTSKYDIIAKTN